MRTVRGAAPVGVADPTEPGRRRAPGRRTLAGITAAALAAGIVGIVVPAAGAATTRYELESGTLFGGAVVAKDHTGYSGSGFVGGFTDGNQGKAKASVSVSAPAAGTYDLQLGFANGTGSTRTFTLSIDGTSRQISLPATANWDTWSTATTSATLSKGAHTVAYAFGSSDNGNANLDYVNLVSKTTPTPTPTPTATPTKTSTPTPTPSSTQQPSSPTIYQAEDATLTGGADKETEHSGYTGSGYVGGYIDSRRDLARTTFSVTVGTAGSYTLGLRYANGTPTTRTLTLDVDTSAQQISLPTTSAWDSWSTQTVTTTLAAGTHKIAYSYGGGDNGNANLDSLTVTKYTAPPPVVIPPSSGEGATVPYDEYVASSAGSSGSSVTTNGSKLDVSRTYTTIAAESTGRSAVQLTQSGQYVAFTLQHAANSLVVRYALPANQPDSTLSVLAGTKDVGDLKMTSKYSSLYGNGYDSDSHTVGNGPAHHFYDETRLLIGDQPAGTVIKLQKSDGDNSPSYVIDLIDTEQVAAAGTIPSGFYSATDSGVVPNSGKDETAHIKSAISDAKSRGLGLFFPKGDYLISDNIAFSDLKIKGAGMWWTSISVLPQDGIGGLAPQGGTISISDLTIYGNQTRRINGNMATGIEGVYGSGSTISNVWIEHTKVGIWSNEGTSGLTITGTRIRDVWADGVHFNGGTSGSTIKQSVFRNLGDDAIAFDTETFTGGATAVVDCTADHNTIANVVQANGVGVYGGGGDTVSNNLVTDSVAYGSGITVSNRFGTGFTGTTTVTGNRLIRTGGAGPGYEDEIGALWIVADTQAQNGKNLSLDKTIVLSNNTVLDSTFAGVKVSYPGSVSDLRLTGNTITGAGTYGIEVRASSGNATISSTTVSGAQSGGLKNGGNNFRFTDGGGNSGINF